MRVAKFFLISIMVVSCAQKVVGPTITPTNTIEPSPHSPTITPTTTSTSTATPPPTTIPFPTATSTPIPFFWGRIALADFLPREPITAIAIDPNDPKVLYAGTENAGIYKSIDGGVSWLPTNNGINLYQVSSIVVVPQNPQTIYAGTSQFGLFKTLDGGERWSIVNKGILQQNGRESGLITLDQTNSQRLYYVTENLIHVSVDGAQSWRLVKPNGTCPHQIFTPQSLAVDPLDFNILFASHWDVPHCTPGVYKSVDGGKIWKITTLQEGGIAGVFIERTSVERYFVYAYVSWGDRFYVSADGGETWQRLSRVCSLMVPHPKGGMLAYCGRSVMHVSNGGATWHSLGWSPIEDVRAIAISPSNSDIIALAGESFYISYDGGKTWQERTNGFPAHRFEVRVHPAEPQTLYAYSWTKHNSLINPLYVSRNGGSSWQLVIREGNGLQFDADSVTLYRYDQVLHRSRNGGENWQTLPLPDVPQKRMWSLARVFTHPSQSNVLYFITVSNWPNIDPGVIYVSTDGGTSWTIQSIIRNWIGLYTPSLFFYNDKPLYLIPFFQAYRSLDDGISWVECKGWDIEWSSPTDSRLVINPNNPMHILVASLGKGVLGSRNGCDNWTSKNNGLPTKHVSTLVLDPQNPNVVYASTDMGVYISFDFGEKWHEVNNGLLGTRVVYLVTADNFGNIYATTPYGIYALKGSGSSGK